MNKLQALLQVIEPQTEQLGLDGSPNQLYEPMRYIMSLGGKRVRPAMVLGAFKLYQEHFTDDVISLAMATEMFHNFSLVHDDIMDHSDLRRGSETVHKKWDTATAILSGDLLLIKVYERLCNLNIAGLLPIFNKMAIALCEGQMMDMKFEDQAQVSNEQYLMMIEKKTAVLLAFALETGGLLAGAPKAERQHLYQLGIHLGLSFQLIDDYLDSFGDGQITGKRVGGDIIEHKKTYLWNAMMDELTDYQQLDLIKAADSLSEEEYINKVKAEMIQTQADKKTKKLAIYHHNQAMQLLNAIEVPGEKDFLYEILNLLAERQR